jgi:hypothetical protein
LGKWETKKKKRIYCCLESPDGDDWLTWSATVVLLCWRWAWGTSPVVFDSPFFPSSLLFCWSSSVCWFSLLFPIYNLFIYKFKLIIKFTSLTKTSSTTSTTATTFKKSPVRKIQFSQKSNSPRPRYPRPP